MVSFAASGANWRGRLLGGRGFHEDDEHVRAFAAARGSALARGMRHGHRARCRVLDGKPVARIFSTCSRYMS